MPTKHDDPMVVAMRGGSGLEGRAFTLCRGSLWPTAAGAGAAAPPIASPASTATATAANATTNASPRLSIFTGTTSDGTLHHGQNPALGLIEREPYHQWAERAASGSPTV
jgi:hypothetical protein